MEFRGSVLLPAPIDAVWAALNDPEILKAGVKGCRSIERETPNRLVLVVGAKVGPVKTDLKGSVTLSDLNPPHSYSMIGQGIGGMAEQAKGQADVTLSEEGGQTRLRYLITASVGGALGRLTGKILDAAAERHIRRFFERIGEALQARAAHPDTPATDSPLALLARARQWLEHDHGVAVATVVKTWGSAPRPAGSKLIIRDDGHFEGSVSGGCVEAEVITEGLDRIAAGGSRTLRFGVSDDDAIAAGLACGGEILIHIEALEA